MMKSDSSRFRFSEGVGVGGLQRQLDVVFISTKVCGLILDRSGRGYNHLGRLQYPVKPIFRIFPVAFCLLFYFLVPKTHVCL